MGTKSRQGDVHDAYGTIKVSTSGAEFRVPGPQVLVALSQWQEVPSSLVEPIATQVRSKAFVASAQLIAACTRFAHG